MRILGFFVVAVLFAAPPAFAADGKKVEVLLQTMHVEQTMQQMQDVLLAGFKDGAIKACVEKGETPERCQQGVPELMVPIANALTDAFKWESIKPEFVAVYARTLTDQEVDAAIAYYGSPDGQSMLSKMPQLMQQGAEIGRRRMEEARPRLMAEMEAVVKKLNEEDKARNQPVEKK